MNPYENPFPMGSDRYQIWEMLVKRDITAFCQADWDAIAADFIADNFMGIDARKRSNPDSWSLHFPDLAAYRKEWLRQAVTFKQTQWKADPEKAIYDATTLRDIQIQGDAALAHKKFDGQLQNVNGEWTTLNWQTLYRCRRVDGHWKIAGFTGYMPHVSTTPHSISPAAAIRLPASASQHQTAGPYSPVLEVQPGKIVVLSGQAAIDPSGIVIGEDIEAQTHATMQNCLQQLKAVNCTFHDVFKVNVYLTDLANWPRFNQVYKTYFADPKPVRTAVQTPLLLTLLVEVEMWAVKP